jgi:RND family efflux transporter MFP subunit
MMRQLFQMGIQQRAGLVFSLLALSLLVASCGKEKAAPARQAPPVTVVKPTVGPVAEFTVFTGSSRAFESANIVARVAGTLESMDFEASRPVKAGDLLFTIEDDRYLAARDVAQANVQSAEADLLRSETELRRVEKASKSRAVSEMDVDRARADRDMAIASVASAKALLADAELDLSYTRVQSPIDGYASRNLVDVGNLVGQGEATLLTRINKVQPIYVYFHAPESVVLKILAGRRERMSKEGRDTEKGIGAALANDQGFPHEGIIDFIDNEVDANTGTIELRARLENLDQEIFPGLFVRIKVEGPTIPDAVLIPETAVGSDLGGKYVLVVGEENIVEQKYITLGAAQGDGTIFVKDGLDGQETVIVGGLMIARPGMPVTPLTAEQFEAMKKQSQQTAKK